MEEHEMDAIVHELEAKVRLVKKTAFIATAVLIVTTSAATIWGLSERQEAERHHQLAQRHAAAAQKREKQAQASHAAARLAKKSETEALKEAQDSRVAAALAKKSETEAREEAQDSRAATALAMKSETEARKELKAKKAAPVASEEELEAKVVEIDQLRTIRSQLQVTLDDERTAHAKEYKQNLLKDKLIQAELKSIGEELLRTREALSKAEEEIKNLKAELEKSRNKRGE